MNSLLPESLAHPAPSQVANASSNPSHPSLRPDALMGVNLIEVVRLTSLLHSHVAPQMTAGRPAGIGKPPRSAGAPRNRRRSTEDRTMPKAPKFLKGQLLLDGGNLYGSWFHRTVVLICQHDAEGAFGLVLNKLSGNKVGDALVADLPDRIKELPLFVGGPVQGTAMSFLHTDAYLPNANVLPNLGLSHSLDELVELGDSFSSTQQFRLFAGYAGWSPGQLEDEMRRNAWLVHPATLDLVFHTEPASLWQDILRKKGWRYRLLAESPEDLSWN